MHRLSRRRQYWRAALGVLRRHQWHATIRPFKRGPAAPAVPLPHAVLLLSSFISIHAKLPRHRIAMGRKKSHDNEASGSGVKDEAPGRVPLNATLGHAMHEKWIPCNWSNVRMPGGWRLSHLRVPVPPVPADEPARTEEVRRRRKYLPADLRADPNYAVDSPRWRSWRDFETEKRRIAGYLGDRDYPFGRPPTAGRRRSPTPPPPPRAAPPPSLENFPGRVVRDDSDDFVAAVLYGLQQAQANGYDYDMPEDMTDDEMTRLGVLMSQLPQDPPPLPRYAVEVMPRGLSEEEAYQLALQESMPPQAPQVSPPAPAAPAYAPPAADWPWEIPAYIIIPDEDEDEQ